MKPSTQAVYTQNARSASYAHRVQDFHTKLDVFYAKFGNEATEELLEILDAHRGRIWAKEQEKNV